MSNPLEQTVTIPVVDLYDFLTRRKDDPMPDLNQATSVKRVKRGYRKVSMTLRLHEYETLSRIAERETRTPDQQAAHMMRDLIKELNEAQEHNARFAEERKAMADATVEEEREAWEDDPRIEEAPIEVLGRGNAPR